MTIAPLEAEGIPQQEALPLASFLDSLPACCELLRPYQRDQIAHLAAVLHTGHRRVVAQAPTGSGKTHLIASLCAAAAQQGLRALILATRSRLVRQLHERLTEFEVPHGVIAAPLPELRHSALGVQVASADTLYRRALVDRRMPLPPADLAVFDEAHLAGADTRLALLESYPQALRLGFTATPARKSGRGLGNVFDALVLGPCMLDLIASGMLVRRCDALTVKSALKWAFGLASSNSQSIPLTARAEEAPEPSQQVLRGRIRIVRSPLRRGLTFAVTQTPLPPKENFKDVEHP